MSQQNAVPQPGIACVECRYTTVFSHVLGNHASHSSRTSCSMTDRMSEVLAQVAYTMCCPHT